MFRVPVDAVRLH